jgi:hypothetical protein
MLKSSFFQVARANDSPYLIIGVIPVFSVDFLVDIRNAGMVRAIGNFSRAAQPEYRDPIYTFDGLERRETRSEYTVKFRRNGLLSASLQIPLRPPLAGQEGQQILIPTAVDVQLRGFVPRASAVFEASGVGAPYIFGMALRTQRPLIGAYAAVGGLGEQHTEPIPAGDYMFPYMQVDDLSQTDRVIRPFCDQTHQMFGKEASPSFDAEGAWVARYG